MGRKKLNRTKDELKQQSNQRSKRYYERNREAICEKRMHRYLRAKEQKDKLSKSLSEHYQTHKHCWNDRSHTDKSKAKMAMYIWITDGTQSKRHIRTEPIPVGYKKGRLYKRKLIDP